MSTSDTNANSHRAQLPPATDAVALAQALIRCPSVTPADAGALDLLQGVLEPMGFACHRLAFTEHGTPDIDNLYARLGTARPHLCFAGHTDVVPPGNEAAWTVPPFAAEVRDGILYGRGAVDMKTEIACFIAAFARLQGERAEAIPGSVSLLITGDEEGPAINGTLKVLDWLKGRGETIDACLVGEPSNPSALGDEIKIGRRGSLNGELIVKGRQGHAAYPAKADNPVPKLARMIDRLSSAHLDDGSERFEPSHLVVTVISVPNTATNVIPGEARASFNIRYNDRWTRPKLEAWARDVCANSAEEVRAEFTLKFWGTGDVFCTEPGPLVETISEAVRDITGRTPALTTGGGTSDARFIKDACPVVEFGLVNETIHKVDEHVPLADIETLTQIYRRFIEKYFKLA
ncbi:MAG: succinyl-diaminopimelate desuccinylase [Alphaproteobacteria bacterium]|nr:succinyl-diaminopimelate desuccinylase [Alphaproteobacteria bacterium]